MTSPLVLCVAPNGAYRTKRDHRQLPITAGELARDAEACVDAGASVLHLHARGPDGAHVLEAEACASLVEAVRRRVGDRLLVQVTTEAAGRYRAPDQIAFVRALRPEAISIAVRELIPDAAAEADAARFLRWAADEGVAVQYIVYSPAERARLGALVDAGVVPADHVHALFVLGRDAAARTDPDEALAGFLREWPAAWPWTACAFGLDEVRCAAAAARLGGHVRVGFENNLHLADGRVAADNAALVRQARELGEAAGRPAATVEAARAVYGCQPRAGRRASGRAG